MLTCLSAKPDNLLESDSLDECCLCVCDCVCEREPMNISTPRVHEHVCVRVSLPA